MTPDTLRAFFRAGILVLISGIFLALLNRPDSAEFVVSLCSVMIGAALIVAVVLVNRLTQ